MLRYAKVVSFNWDSSHVKPNLKLSLATYADFSMEKCLILSVTPGILYDSGLSKGERKSEIAS